MAEPHTAGAEVDADRLIHLRNLVGHLPEPKLAAAGRPGGFPTRARGNGLDIREVRPYVEGDDFRHVDAMTTARTGRVHVRSFHDDRDKAALLIADFRPPMLWGTRRRLKSVAAAEVLALCGWQAVMAGGRLGAMIVGLDEVEGSFLALRSRDRAMAEAAGLFAYGHARAMAAAGRARSQTLEVSLEQAGRLMPSGSTLYLATALDDAGDDFDALAEAIARRMRLVVLLVTDAFETAPLPGGYPWFTRPGRVNWTDIGVKPSVPPDPRPERLRRLGAEVRLVDAAATDEQLCLALLEDSRHAA
ncbi:DUF58 domain-containing protein [Oryzibacter oryziterrae]|uniref:DUF58 domain-containing protein n=1 Tax=Oryzibacter oryziterrae TaxID=2766474 RepID=UPI001F3933F7|nr:DUF58 domain-containing protein [Oryzibacter oryziterrae]